jgi:serine/threonine-protein kinase
VKPSLPSLRECFDQLVDLEPAQREQWFARHAPDAALCEELQAMLAADGDESPVLATSAAELIQHYTPPHESGAGLVGSEIGPYRLLVVLGQGGTSVVFRAQRASGAGTQTVALKLLRTGLFSTDGQRRFRREQGVLAQLSHPNIARLIDGGITDAGIPYIAMEFVDGQPITDFANARALDLRARLQLLAKTCRAVDSAHRALVVHRDLKPSNVLVDADGEIKVLDFGIARLLDDEDHPATQTHAISLTPGYAAPEQYLPGPVTTATDIYALGILMGELLTGRLLPNDDARFDLSRACAESTEPMPAGLPSKQVLARTLRGDLDAIHGSAHAFDANQRYLSAALLADDLERYLRNEPVTARPPSLAYRLRKSVQRNRAAALAALLAFVAIAAGVSLALWQARIAREQAQRATTVRDFLMELFDAAKAGQMPDKRMTLEQLTHRASTRLQARTDLPAGTRIEFLRTLGDVSTAGSDYAQAEQLYAQAAELARTVYAPTDEVRIQLALLQANLLLHQSRYADAGTAYEALLPWIRAGRDAARVEALRNYAAALMYSARTERALAISEEATRTASAVYGAGSNGDVLARLARGNLLTGSGHYADAAPLLETALQDWRTSGREPSEEFLQGLTDLSRVRQALGDSAAAEALLRETLATAEQLYDAPHDRIALALLNLGDALRLQGRLDDAEPLLTRALAMMQAIYGEGHLRVANTLASLGKLELRRRDLDRAATHFRAALAWCERPDLHATRSCVEHYANEADVALARDDLDDADASSKRALAMAQDLFGNRHHWTARLLQVRAELALRRNDAPSALALCDQANDVLTRLGERDGLTAESVLARRARVLDALGRSDEALAEVTRALALWQRLAPAGHLHRIELLDALASIQAHRGDRRAAEDSARQAIALVGDRRQVEPALLARIEALAAPTRPIAKGSGH